MKSKNIIKWAKKIKAIELLGGKCVKCEDDNIFHLTFHHEDKTQKDFNINHIKYSNWNEIEKEVKKCTLLCNNCHQEHHYDKEEYLLKKSKARTNKKLFLKIKNNIGCEKCNYNKSEYSLTFHHTSDKKFKFGEFSVEFKSIDDLSQEILLELNNCQVLCRNCHNELHTDKKFFEQYREEIYDKVKNFKIHNYKLDRKLIKKMYFMDKMNQKEIAEKLKCSEGTISSIIVNIKKNEFGVVFKKQINITKDISDKIKKMYFELGFSQIDIAKKFNYTSGTISNLIRKIKHEEYGIICKKNSPKINIELLKNMYFEQELSVVDISVKLGCHKNSIHKIIRKIKITL